MLSTLTCATFFRRSLLMLMIIGSTQRTAIWAIQIGGESCSVTYKNQGHGRPRSYHLRNGKLTFFYGEGHLTSPNLYQPKSRYAVVEPNDHEHQQLNGGKK